MDNSQRNTYFLGQFVPDNQFQPPSPRPEPEPAVEPQKYGWFEDKKRNKPQSNSLVAASLIFTASGLASTQDMGFDASHYYSFTNLRISWFIAVSIGAFFSTVYMQSRSQRFFYLISSILVIANGIIYISASTNVTAIMIGRVCCGFAFGHALIPAIVGGSEQSVKRFRGLILSTEQIGLSTGIMIKMFVVLLARRGNWDVNQVQGIVVLVCGKLAFLMNLGLTIESPVFYLRKDREADAVKALQLLQRPHAVTTETRTLLEDNKKLLAEDISRGYVANSLGGVVPLLKLCLFRGFISLSYTLPLIWGSMALSYLYGVMRLLGAIIASYTLDTIGRKFLSGVSLLIGGGLLIGFAVMITRFLNSEDWFETNVTEVLIFLLFYQVLNGFAATASTCYLGEAFSVSVKPYFILIVVGFENVLQMIVYIYFEDTLLMIRNGFVVGICQTVFAILFFVIMPETKKTTLREALAKFNVE